MAEATSPELIPLEDTALEIAWMTHARWAALNTQELQETSAQGLLYVAEDIGLGGDIREHRLYDDLLLGAASSLLPGQTYE